MPQYRIEAPDGVLYDWKGPNPPSPEQLRALAAQHAKAYPRKPSPNGDPFGDPADEMGAPPRLQAETGLEAKLRNRQARLQKLVDRVDDAARNGFPGPQVDYQAAKAEIRAIDAKLAKRSAPAVRAGTAGAVTDAVAARRLVRDYGIEPGAAKKAVRAAREALAQQAGKGLGGTLRRAVPGNAKSVVNAAMARETGRADGRARILPLPPLGSSDPAALPDGNRGSSGMGPTVLQAERGVLVPHVEPGDATVVNSGRFHPDVSRKPAPAIRYLVRRALADRSYARGFVIDHMDQAWKERVFADTGVRLENSDLVLTADDVRHSHKNHGDPTIEKNRGRAVLAPGQWLQVGRVVRDYDRAIPGDKPGTIVFSKTIGKERIVVVAEGGKAKNKLFVKTTYTKAWRK